jgi:hypothetical protein
MNEIEVAKIEFIYELIQLSSHMNYGKNKERASNPFHKNFSLYKVLLGLVAIRACAA